MLRVVNLEKHYQRTSQRRHRSTFAIRRKVRYDSIHATTVKLEGSEVVITDGDRIVRVAITPTPKPSEVRACRCRCQVRGCFSLLKSAGKCQDMRQFTSATRAHQLRGARLEGGSVVHGRAPGPQSTGSVLRERREEGDCVGACQGRGPYAQYCGRLQRGEKGRYQVGIGGSACERVASPHEVSRPLMRAQLTARVHMSCVGGICSSELIWLDRYWLSSARSSMFC